MTQCDMLAFGLGETNRTKVYDLPTGLRDPLGKEAVGAVVGAILGGDLWWCGSPKFRPAGACCL